MKHTKTIFALGFAVTAIAMSGNAAAGQIFSQGQLASILGGNETMEDFEGMGLLPSGQLYETSGLLNSSTTFDGFGPGVVRPGVDYMSPALWLNDNGYFGLNTRTLADCSGWRGDSITMAYTQAVTAMGFDMQGYQGYRMDGSVDVYNVGGGLISHTEVNGGFFGWEDGGGIGKVVVNAYPDQSYIMIDNHGYGAAVPEPASFAILGLGLIPVLRRRAKK